MHFNVKSTLSFATPNLSIYVVVCDMSFFVCLPSGCLLAEPSNRSPSQAGPRTGTHLRYPIKCLHFIACLDMLQLEMFVHPACAKTRRHTCTMTCERYC